MDKQYILDKIREITNVSGNPPGQEKFGKITGLKRTDWYGRYWTKWSDAVTEAGFVGNQYNQAYPKEVLLKHYLNLVIDLQKIPSTGEIRIKCNNDSSYPGHTTFQNVLGNKNEQLAALLEYAKSQNASDDIVKLIVEGLKSTPIKSAEKKPDGKIGYIYLIQFGIFYKIGHSNDFDRRLREIKTKLPEEGVLVHVIETDDPEGIEAYWHNRFKEKRARGEWFKLQNDDVKVFRKRKFM
jgi:hypothetical protein